MKGEIHMYFAWKDEYRLDIDAIDEQHQKIFEIGRRLADAVFMPSGVDHETIARDVLNELKDYAVYHFQFEESYFRNSGYIHVETHLKEHQYALDRIKHIEESCADENWKEIVIKILDLVSHWIVNHILKSDMRFKSINAHIANNK